MAMNFRDPRNGFRHREVVGFINEEILRNGGSPDFFLAFGSQPWNEVEDQLRLMVLDPQVPSPIKKACAWSALALSVRLAARQQQQQTRRVRRLQEQVEEREAATRVLASELQRLREEREEMASRLRCTCDTLQQALEEREVLRKRRLEVEKWAKINPQVVTRLPADQRGEEAWPQHAEEQGKVAATGAQSRLDAESRKEEAQTEAQEGVFYVPEHLSPWAQVFQPLLPMPHSHAFPYPTPFSMAFQYTPPPPPTFAMETEAAAVPPQMPRGRIYIPGLWAAVRSQEEMAPLWDQRSQGREEGAVIWQEVSALVDSRSHGQEEATVRPNFINLSGHNWNQGDSRKQPQEQRTWPPKGKKAFESQQQEKSAPNLRLRDWNGPWGRL